MHKQQENLKQEIEKCQNICFCYHPIIYRILLKFKLKHKYVKKHYFLNIQSCSSRLENSTWSHWAVSGLIKGIGSLISRDPPFKDGKARFTTVPLKTLILYKMWKKPSFF